MKDFDTFTKIASILLVIWAKYLLHRALKSCPKYNKSPNLFTLIVKLFIVKHVGAETAFISFY